MNDPRNEQISVIADRDTDGQPCVIFNFGQRQQDGSLQIADRKVLTVADACLLVKELSVAIFDAEVLAVMDENVRPK